MMGTKPSLVIRAASSGLVTPSYRRTATYIALAHLLGEGGTLRGPPCVDQRAQCGGLEGLTQLARNRERRSSKNFPSTHSGEYSFAGCAKLLGLATSVVPSPAPGEVAQEGEKACPLKKRTRPPSDVTSRRSGTRRTWSLPTRSSTATYPTSPTVRFSSAVPRM